MTAREARIAEIVGAVARQALADRGAQRIALLDDGGPEAALAARMLASTLGVDAVLRVTVDEGEMESVLHAAPQVSGDRAAEEMRRMKARLVEHSIPAHPASKTALLLGGELPPEPLLPLGDLWASEVAELAGAWSGPPDATMAASLLGGVEALDEALRGLVDRRDPSALDALPREVAWVVTGALERGRPSRLHPRIVPKIGARTLGVDLFD